MVRNSIFFQDIVFYVIEFAVYSLAGTIAVRNVRLLTGHPISNTIKLLPVTRIVWIDKKEESVV